MKFKKKIKIDQATSFKLEYQTVNSELKTKVFSSLKLMDQFHKRQKGFNYLDIHRYALIDNVWHRFIKLKSPFVFKSNLETLNKNFEDFNPQK